jgi:hypothetical protein
MSSDQFPWPKRGMKAFVGAGDGKFFHVPSAIMGFPPHANAFKDAASMLIDTHLADHANRDALLLPICYLYRHGLEIKLKALIGLGVAHHFLKREDVEEVIEGHNLKKLWVRVQEVLQRRWPHEDQAPVIGVNTVIEQFHQADPNGQVFRYDRTRGSRDRHRFESLPVAIDIARLRASMEAVWSFLETCEDVLHDDFQNTP